jgi:hypothetical protein
MNQIALCWLALKVVWLILILMMSLRLVLLLLLLLCLLLWLVIPMSLLFAPSGCPFIGLFLYSLFCIYIDTITDDCTTFPLVAVFNR